MGWIAAVVGVVGAIGSAEAAKKNQQNANKAQAGLTESEAKWQRENSMFDAQQQYYYQQLDKQEKMRGLDQFRKFSTVSNYTPDFHDDNPGPIVPDQPMFDRGIYDTKRAPSGIQTGGSAQLHQGGSGGSGGLLGILSQADPISGALTSNLIGH
jgi:hypothetical protein